MAQQNLISRHIKTNYSSRVEQNHKSLECKSKQISLLAKECGYRLILKKCHLYTTEWAENHVTISDRCRRNCKQSTGIKFCESGKITMCYVLMTNEMHNSYNQFLFHSFLSAIHVSNESSRSSSGAWHNILYYTAQSVQSRRRTIVPIVLCNTV